MSDERHSKVSHKASDYDSKESRKKRPIVDKSDDENSSDTDHSRHKHKKHKKKKLKKSYTSSHKDKKKHKKTKKSRRHSSTERSYSSKRNRSRDRKEEKRTHKSLDSDFCKDDTHRKRNKKEQSDHSSKPKRLKSDDKDVKPNQNLTSQTSNSISTKSLPKRGVNLSHLHEETLEVDEIIPEIKTESQKSPLPHGNSLHPDTKTIACIDDVAASKYGSHNDTSSTTSCPKEKEKQPHFSYSFIEMPSKESSISDDPSTNKEASKDHILEATSSVNKNVNNKSLSYISCTQREKKDIILGKDGSLKEVSFSPLMGKSYISAAKEEGYKTSCKTTNERKLVSGKEVPAEIHSFSSSNQNESPSILTTTHNIIENTSKSGASKPLAKNEVKDAECKYSLSKCIVDNLNQPHQNEKSAQNEVHSFQDSSKILDQNSTFNSSSSERTEGCDDSFTKSSLQKNSHNKKLLSLEKNERKKETISPGVIGDSHDLPSSKSHEEDSLDNQHFSSSLSSFIFSELEKYMDNESNSRKNNISKDDKSSPDQAKPCGTNNKEISQVDHENDVTTYQENSEALAISKEAGQGLDVKKRPPSTLSSDILNKAFDKDSYPSCESTSEIDQGGKSMQKIPDFALKSKYETSPHHSFKEESYEDSCINIHNKNVVVSKPSTNDSFKIPSSEHSFELSKEKDAIAPITISESSEQKIEFTKICERENSSNDLRGSSTSQKILSLETSSPNASQICNKDNKQDYPNDFKENQNERKEKIQTIDSSLVKSNNIEGKKSRSESKEINDKEKLKSKSKEKKSNEEKKTRQRKKSRSTSNHKSQSIERRSRSKSRLRKGRSRSRNRDRSRSKDILSKSTDRRKSRSRERRKSRSKERRKSRSRERKRSQSKERKSISRERRRSRERKKSRSKERRRSISKERRKRSKSKERRRNRSNEKRRSRSIVRRRSRSKERNRSKERRRSRSKERRKSRSKERRRSSSKERRRSRSKERRKSRSKERSRSRTGRESKSRELQRGKSKEKLKIASKERSQSKSLEEKKDIVLHKKEEYVDQQSPQEQVKENSSSEEIELSHSYEMEINTDTELKDANKRSQSSEKIEIVNQKEDKFKNIENKDLHENKNNSNAEQCDFIPTERQDRSDKRKESRDRSSSKSSRERSVAKDKKNVKDTKSEDKNKRKKRSKSKEKKRSLSREKRKTSPERRRKSRERRRTRSRSIERRKNRGRRSLSRGRKRSRSRVRSSRQRDLGTRRLSPSFRISPPRRYRSRSRSRRRRSRSRSVEKIDKAQLLEAARKNMLEMIEKGTIPQSLLVEKKPLKPIVMPVVHSSAPEPAALKGKSVDELTDMCRAISEKERKEEAGNDDSSEDSKGSPIIFHPFKIKESQPITMNIRNSTQLPVKNLQEKVASRVQFPVSSGRQHRQKELEWIPVEQPTSATASATTSNPSVAESTSQPLPELSTIIAMQIKASQILKENPLCVEAQQLMKKAETLMHQWSLSRAQPGQYIGTTDVELLTPVELEGPTPAWARKDQFVSAAPVSEGIGMTLLKKMGWNPGEGLGKNKEGSLVPLMPDIKIDKRGLTSEQELVPHKSANPILPSYVLGRHPVSALMEICSKNKWGPPSFLTATHEGPPHSPTIKLKVKVRGVEYEPPEVSCSKKEAKYHAAVACLQALGYLPKTSKPADSSTASATSASS